MEIVFTRNILAVASNELISNDVLIITNLNVSQIKIELLNKSSVVNFKAFGILGELIIETKPNANNFIIDTNVKKLKCFCHEFSGLYKK